MAAIEGRIGMEWFALTVKPNHERTVAGLAGNKGLDVLLPAHTVRRRWADRVKQISVPLFPGYVFCRFAIEAKVSILRTPGVRGIVGFGDGPVPIPQEEISALEKLMSSGRALEPWPYLETGQRVMVRDGPLRGVTGVLLRVSNTWRVVVGVELLRRSVAAELDRDSVEPLPALAAKMAKL